MTRLPRAAVRTVVPLAAAAVLWAAATPSAMALTRDDGDQPGPGLSMLAALGLYVGIPLLVCLALVLLTYGPSGARAPRYRPGLTWWAEPVWIGGPSVKVSAPSSTIEGDPQAHATAASAVAATAQPTGGARARW